MKKSTILVAVSRVYIVVGFSLVIFSSILGICGIIIEVTTKVLPGILYLLIASILIPIGAITAILALKVYKNNKDK